MNNGSKSRNSAYGQKSSTLIDKIGVFLSHRKILKYTKELENITVLDIGCGFHASALQLLLPRIKEGHGIDFSISDQLKSIESLNFKTGNAENFLSDFTGNYYDLVLMISVLEHFWHPNLILNQCYRLLKDDGKLLINVPTWTGKKFLEFFAFQLQLSPKEEMNDHKMYYNKSDLWPMIIHAGFKPSRIKMKYIKFGLNLFCIITK